MSFKQSQFKDYEGLGAPRRNGDKNFNDDLQTLKPLPVREFENSTPPRLPEKINKPIIPETEHLSVFGEIPVPIAPPEKIDQAAPKSKKAERVAQKDFRILTADSRIERAGHLLTYGCLYLFSILVLFRPYEIIPGLGFLSATAFYFALATLFFYVPLQISTEGTLTTLSTEVKCVLAMIVLAFGTMIIGKDFKHSWEVFNDIFIKAVLIFIVMVNVLRTRRRLLGLMGLSLVVGVVLSYLAIGMSMRGEMKTEGYRVAVDVGGMYGNPNDMALHLVTMTPLAICFGLATKSRFKQILFFGAAVLLLSGNLLTQSRGGFLGLIVSSLVLAWKVGRRSRLKTMLATGFAGLIFLALAPADYGKRILSIFIPGLDKVGSSNQRGELLNRSLFVTARNPWGIGMGNFRIMNDYGLETHNAYTQVSTELGLAGLAVYLLFLIVPIRKLLAIERTQIAQENFNFYYYLAIGLQASIVGYMVSSFFASVAYNWYAYYLIAYAIAFRRIYLAENKQLQGSLQ